MTEEIKNENRLHLGLCQPLARDVVKQIRGENHQRPAQPDDGVLLRRIKKSVESPGSTHQCIWLNGLRSIHALYPLRVPDSCERCISHATKTSQGQMSSGGVFFQAF